MPTPGLITILIGLGVSAGFLILLSAGRYKHASLWRWIGSLLIAFPAAVLSYLVVGIKLAPRFGEPRFYSFPIGGGAYKTNDAVIGWSLVCWTLAWAAVFYIFSALLHKYTAAERR